MFPLQSCKLLKIISRRPTLYAVLSINCRLLYVILFRFFFLTSFVAFNGHFDCRFNDKSVLEMYHVSRAFQILRRPSCNILSHVSEETYREVRSNVINMVLGTDMSLHFQHLNAFKALKATKGETFRCETNEEKRQVMDLLLHFADVRSILLCSPLTRLLISMRF